MRVRGSMREDWRHNASESSSASDFDRSRPLAYKSESISRISHRIREMDPYNPQDVAEATRLHLTLLPFGPMAQLGELFLKRFCYTVLLREGLMRAALCEVGGQPAGFIAYTDRSITFHRAGLKRHLGYVAFLVLISIVRDPRVIGRLWKACRLMFSRRSEKHLGEDPSAEILAIGVLPEYRIPPFIRRTGIRISQELVNHAASHFEQMGLKSIRAFVDADNRATLMFYHSLAGRLEHCQQAGKQVVQVWLDTEKIRGLRQEG